jgi:hypothetical protein
MNAAEAHYQEQIPWIDWLSPVAVETAGARTEFGCRFCIAIFGLKGEDVQFLPTTREDFDRHMREQHGVTQ